MKPPAVEDDEPLPKPCVMTDVQLRWLLERAVEEGVKRGLERVGLHDEDAVHDMREVRNLLDAWRSAKSAVWATIVKAATVAMMGALAAGMALQWWDRRP
jgi:hypothetical protein